MEFVVDHVDIVAVVVIEVQTAGWLALSSASAMRVVESSLGESRQRKNGFTTKQVFTNLAQQRSVNNWSH